jgi:DNA (cytosine-5)-methyltransferase 1
MNLKINYLDLFSGIGGFAEGLKQSGFLFSWHGFSEIDQYAKKIYQRHFPFAEDMGDVKAIKLDRRKINLVTFGFPCQDLSISGNRSGLAGEKSGLFFEAIKIIDWFKPDYFIFENVPGLFSSNERKDFGLLLRSISDIGYDGQWQVLNTAWVLPQNRERIYFVGYSGRVRRPQIFPLGEGSRSNGKTWKKVCTLTTKQGNFRGAGETVIVVKKIDTFEERDIINAIDANYYKGPDNHQQRSLIKVGSLYDGDSQGGRIYDVNGISCQLTALGGGLGAKTGLYKTGDRIRRLTPTECEKLQGFEPGWCDELSDMQKYKCLGNAVTVPIVKMVAEKLKEEWMFTVHQSLNEQNAKILDCAPSESLNPKCAGFWAKSKDCFEECG